jgi:hypothetical protein
MAQLPKDKHHRPVPWFVAWVDGQPDFRIIKPDAPSVAVDRGKCWVCGQRWPDRQAGRAFVIGPMCVVNHISAEPPSHYSCALYSALHCPFLATPGMQRRERHLPQDTTDPPGTFVRRNPGVACVYVVRYNAWSVIKTRTGPLFDIGDPVRVEWFAEGRQATRAEVMASLESGLPILHGQVCQGTPGSRAACAELDRQYEAALQLVPS